MFATACHSIVDAAAGSLRYASAGHPRPLHLHRKEAIVNPLAGANTPGPALGLFADAVYPTQAAPVAADDVLLLFTDGLYEVFNPSAGDQFGKSRLLATARQHLNLPPEQLCDAVMREVRQFGGSSDFADDVCLLSVHVAKLQ